jgi:hypothetical protein
MRTIIKLFFAVICVTCIAGLIPATCLGYCDAPEDVVNYGYIGGCDHTKRTSFILSERTYISNIRVWYDTNVGGNRLVVDLTGPNGYNRSATLRNSEQCQWSWCAAHWELDETLPAGNYRLSADSRSICADPSEKTTLIISGCFDDGDRSRVDDSYDALEIDAPPPIEFDQPPEIAVVPGEQASVYIIPNTFGVYFFDNSWYRFYNGFWFRSSAYNDRWFPIPFKRVPRYILDIPPEYPRLLPRHYHRVRYNEFNREWRNWERDRYWHRQEWYRKELRPETRRERLHHIEREREKWTHNEKLRPPGFLPPLPGQKGHFPSPIHKPGVRPGGADRDHKPNVREPGGKPGGSDREQKPNVREPGTRPGGTDRDHKPVVREPGGKPGGSDREQKPSVREPGVRPGGADRDHKPNVREPVVRPGGRPGGAEREQKPGAKESGSRPGSKHEEKPHAPGKKDEGQHDKN